MADRPSGLELGYIPITAILAHARDIGALSDPDELREYVRLVRAIDDEFLRAERGKRPPRPP